MSLKLVGILNVTPDSFSDGGKFVEPTFALAQAEQLFTEGADIVDIGAEATNPKAGLLTVDEEWQRLDPILKVLLPKYPGKISIDTRHSQIVEEATKYGKDFIVNDVTTFIDPAMIAVTAKHGLYAITSHLPLHANGDIQRGHQEFKLDSLEQVRDELLGQKAKMIAGGISAEHIIIDPGIGFGKSMTLNWELLEFAKYVPRDAVLIGHSRKRFLATDPKTGDFLPKIDRHSLKTNLNAAKISVASGATYLRVHEITPYTNLS